MNSRPLNVVIAGGGLAALETTRALLDLAGDRVRITLVAPEPAIALESLRTREPFSAGHVTRIPLRQALGPCDLDIRRDRLVRVHPADHVVALSSGATLPYDALVLAVGARPRAAFPHAVTLGAESRSDVLSGLLADLAARFPRSAAFVVPPGTTWPLPIYELALMTARQLGSMGMGDVRIELVSPERAPLALLGDDASHAVEHLLEDFGVTFHGLVEARGVEPGRVDLGDGRKLPVDRVVALPLIDGPAVAGLPSDDRGFVPTDRHGRVSAVADVYAAGDATDFPVKQDCLACQQADAVAQHLAARVGAVLEAQPFSPVLGGKLLTDVGSTYLSHALDDGGGGVVSDFELWWPPASVSGHHLSRALRRGRAARVPTTPHVDVEVPLGATSPAPRVPIAA